MLNFTCEAKKKPIQSWVNTIPTFVQAKKTLGSYQVKGRYWS